MIRTLIVKKNCFAENWRKSQKIGTGVKCRPTECRPTECRPTECRFCKSDRMSPMAGCQLQRNVVYNTGPDSPTQALGDERMELTPG
jgi:hypothetical protein